MAGPNESTASPITPVIPVLVPPTTPEPRYSKKWEILKSIVYGGLVESITSLSIVTSASGADAATCKWFNVHVFKAPLHKTFHKKMH